MMMSRTILATALTGAAAQGINDTQVFAFYTLETTAAPDSFFGDLYSWCGDGPPYCDMQCDGTQEGCGQLAGTYCAEQVVLSNNASACGVVRYAATLNGGRAVASNARGLPPPRGGRQDGWSYWLDVIYDGSQGPFPAENDTAVVVDSRDVPSPISNETVQSFYRVAGSGTPYNTSAAKRTFCAEANACDDTCDGTQDHCVERAAAWCNTPKSPCAVIHFDRVLNKATAADSNGLPPVNLTEGDYTFWVGVSHPADVGPPPTQTRGAPVPTCGASCSIDFQCDFTCPRCDTSRGVCMPA